MPRLISFRAIGHWEWTSWAQIVERLMKKRNHYIATLVICPFEQVTHYHQLRLIIPLRGPCIEKYWLIEMAQFEHYVNSLVTGWGPCSLLWGHFSKEVGVMFETFHRIQNKVKQIHMYNWCDASIQNIKERRVVLGY